MSVGAPLGRAVFVLDADTGPLNQALQASESLARGFASKTGGILQTGLAIGLGTTAYRAGLEAASLLLGSLKTGVIDFNAQMDRSTAIFSKLEGSTAAAQARIASLFEFAKATPFDFETVLKGVTTLEALSGTALTGKDSLNLLGDAAAGTVNITGSLTEGFKQTTFWTARFYEALNSGGATGRSLTRLEQIGLVTAETRKQIEFAAAAGASAQEQFAVYTKGLERYKGLQEEQQQNFTTQISTFTDNLTQLESIAGRPIFDGIVRGLNSLNDQIGNGKLLELSKELSVNVAGAVRSVEGALTSQDNRDQLAVLIKDLGDVAKTALAIGQAVGSVAGPIVNFFELINKGTDGFALKFLAGALLVKNFRREIEVSLDVLRGRTSIFDLPRLPDGKIATGREVESGNAQVLSKRAIANAAAVKKSQDQLTKAEEAFNQAKTRVDRAVDDAITGENTRFLSALDKVNRAQTQSDNKANAAQVRTDRETARAAAKAASDQARADNKAERDEQVRYSRDMAESRKFVSDTERDYAKAIRETELAQREAAKVAGAGNVALTAATDAETARRNAQQRVSLASTNVSSTERLIQARGGEDRVARMAALEAGAQTEVAKRERAFARAVAINDAGLYDESNTQKVKKTRDDLERAQNAAAVRGTSNTNLLAAQKAATAELAAANTQLTATIEAETNANGLLATRANEVAAANDKVTASIAVQDAALRAKETADRTQVALAQTRAKAALASAQATTAPINQPAQPVVAPPSTYVADLAAIRDKKDEAVKDYNRSIKQLNDVRAEQTLIEAGITKGHVSAAQADVNLYNARHKALLQVINDQGGMQAAEQSYRDYVKRETFDPQPTGAPRPISRGANAFGNLEENNKQRVVAQERLVEVQRAYTSATNLEAKGIDAVTFFRKAETTAVYEQLKATEALNAVVAEENALIAKGAKAPASTVVRNTPSSILRPLNTPAATASVAAAAIVPAAVLTSGQQLTQVIQSQSAATTTARVSLLQYNGSLNGSIEQNRAVIDARANLAKKTQELAAADENATQKSNTFSAGLKNGAAQFAAASQYVALAALAFGALDAVVQGTSGHGILQILQDTIKYGNESAAAIDRATIAAKEFAKQNSPDTTKAEIAKQQEAADKDKATIGSLGLASPVGDAGSTVKDYGTGFRNRLTYVKNNPDDPFFAKISERYLTESTSLKVLNDGYDESVKKVAAYNAELERRIRNGESLTGLPEKPAGSENAADLQAKVDPTTAAINALPVSVRQRIIDSSKSFQDTGAQVLTEMFKGFRIDEGHNDYKVFDDLSKQFKSAFTAQQGTTKINPLEAFDIAAADKTIANITRDVARYGSVQAATIEESNRVLGSNSEAVIKLANAYGILDQAQQDASDAAKKVASDNENIKRITADQKSADAPFVGAITAIQRQQAIEQHNNQAANQIASDHIADRQRAATASAQADSDEIKRQQDYIKDMQNDNAALDRTFQAESKSRQDHIKDLQQAQAEIDTAYSKDAKARQDSIAALQVDATARAGALNAVLAGTSDQYLKQAGEVDDLTRKIIARYRAELDGLVKVKDATNDRATAGERVQRAEVLRIDEAIAAAREKNDRAEVARLTLQKQQYQTRSQPDIDLARERAAVAQDNLTTKSTSLQKADQPARDAEANTIKAQQDALTLITKQHDEQKAAADDQIKAAQSALDLFTEQYNVGKATRDEAVRLAQVTLDKTQEEATVTARRYKDEIDGLTEAQRIETLRQRNELDAENNKLFILNQQKQAVDDRYTNALAAAQIVLDIDNKALTAAQANVVTAQGQVTALGQQNSALDTQYTAWKKIIDLLAGADLLPNRRQTTGSPGVSGLNAGDPNTSIENVVNTPSHVNTQSNGKTPPAAGPPIGGQQYRVFANGTAWYPEFGPTPSGYTIKFIPSAGPEGSYPALFWQGSSAINTPGVPVNPTTPPNPDGPGFTSGDVGSVSAAAAGASAGAQFLSLGTGGLVSAASVGKVSLLGGRVPQPTAGAPVQVINQFGDITVREQADIDRIATAVAQKSAESFARVVSGGVRS